MAYNKRNVSVFIGLQVELKYRVSRSNKEYTHYRIGLITNVEEDYIILLANGYDKETLINYDNIKNIDFAVKYETT